MKKKKKNIFVIGDLVIDHTIFVDDKASSKHQHVENEPIYEVLYRQDTAGGAANTARILAAVNEGNTYLWGVLGKSCWGNFRSILEASRVLDGTHRVIILRGVQDETDAPMHTINRIISSRDGLIKHHARFDDYGDIHIPEEKRLSTLSDLYNLHEKNKIDSIIINDLDIACLTKELVEKIAEFANSNKIPLIIDPKREYKKYEKIKAAAIMPNLYEWCHLINEPDRVTFWRGRLNIPKSLIEMAQRSLFFLRNFRYHIIKCDKDGVVIFAPHPKKENAYAIYRMPAYIDSSIPQSHQLGCGDLMAGLLALYLETPISTTAKVLEILDYISFIVAIYREQSWLRMPGEQEIRVREKRYTKRSWLNESVCEQSKSVLFLPKEKDIVLSNYETLVSGLYTLDSRFKVLIKKLLDDIHNNWKQEERLMRSIILGAPAGCGKSTIMELIQTKFAKEFEVCVRDISKQLHTYQNNDLQTYLQKLKSSMCGTDDPLLLMADEALKPPDGKYLKKWGVSLLNAAHKLKIRFLFIDAGFSQKTSTLGLEIETRCQKYILPPLKERLSDIPYIAAAHFLSLGKKNNITQMYVETGVLLCLIDSTIASKDPSPREITNKVDCIYNNALSTGKRKNNQLYVQFTHLQRIYNDQISNLSLHFNDYKLTF